MINTHMRFDNFSSASRGRLAANASGINASAQIDVPRRVPNEKLAKATELRTITEREILLFSKSKVLRQMEIGQTESGAFQLFVSLRLDPGRFILVGTRNRPREWMSLDRLLKHIRGKFGVPCSVTLNLWQQPAVSAPTSAR